MKKCKGLSLFLLLSFVYFGNVFATKDSSGAKGQPDIIAQSDGAKTLDQKEDSKGLEKQVEVKHESKLENKSTSVLDKLKNTACTILTAGIMTGAAYVTYKVSGKIGLNKEIKDVCSLINKTKVLKKVLIGGAIVGAACTALTFWVALKCSVLFLQNIVVPSLKFNAAIVSQIAFHEDITKNCDKLEQK